MKPVAVGDIAPDFDRLSSDGTQVKLSDYQGKQSVVLFFYPRDFTPICTQEVCHFRDQYAAFVDAGAAVIGISGDSDDSHQQFSKEMRLPYPLLSDADGSLRNLYGVPKTLFLLPGRVTYVIDQNRTVRRIFNSQLQGERHIQEALSALKSA